MSLGNLDYAAGGGYSITGHLLHLLNKESELTQFFDGLRQHLM